MRTRYIIARHYENLKWTNRLNDEIVIYNSGPLDSCKIHSREYDSLVKSIRGVFYYPLPRNQVLEYNPLATLIQIPNRAKESSKWLRYLIDYYGQYASVNVFLQGYPFDHVQFEDIVHRSGEYGYIKGSEFDNDFNTPINKVSNGYDQKEIYAEIYGDRMPQKFNWVIGAQFHMTSDWLMKNTKAYYEKLMEVVLEFDRNGPYCYERSWLTFIINSPDYAKV